MAERVTHDPDLARDLARVAAGELPGVLLTAAELGRGLALAVGIEPAKGGLCWFVAVTGGPPGLASRLRLGVDGLAKVQAAVSRAIETAAARGWRIPARDPVVLADVGEVAVGVGAAGGTPWAVIIVADETLRLPAADLARLGDALAVAEARVARASGGLMQ